MGAVHKEDAGLYFSWGNTEGHAKGSGYNFSQDAYNATAAAAITTDLSLSQDMARANLGSLWRLPSKTDIQELYDNCTKVWTTRNGMGGVLFTSNVNGKSIFIPAAGHYSNRTLDYDGSRGYYWSSTYFTAANAYNLRFDSSSVNPQGSTERRYGLPIRAVLKF